MKAKLLFLFIMLISLGSFAQTDTTTISSKVYDYVEHSPSFSGGQEALVNFILTNINYPTQAEYNLIEGIAYTSFIVEEDGTLSDIIAIDSLGYGFDKEAIRLLKMMPPWNPARNYNQTVRASFSIPIEFSLKEDFKMMIQKTKDWTSQAETELQNKRYYQAKQLLDNALKVYPKNHLAHILRGKIFLIYGDTTHATIDWGIAQKIGSKEAQMLLHEIQSAKNKKDLLLDE